MNKLTKKQLEALRLLAEKQGTVSTFLVRALKTKGLVRWDGARWIPVSGHPGTAPTIEFKDGRESVTLDHYPGEDTYGKAVHYLRFAAPWTPEAMDNLGVVR